MRKLEIGPTRKRGITPDGQPRETWDTLDVEGPVTIRCAWGQEPLKVESAAYDWVYASHVLEHIPWWQVDAALREVCRILRPGGRLTLWVPDGVRLVTLYANEPEKLVAQNAKWAYYSRFTKDRSAWSYMNAHIFWGASHYGVGRLPHFHKSIYDAQALRERVAIAGFASAEVITRTTQGPAREMSEVGVEAYKR
jgi:ubiquinone/menaquinone biosynthesis C-methylase UbiE